MAKTVAKKIPPKEEKPPLIPEKYRDWVFIALLIISVFIFFAGAISSGGFKEADSVASMSFKTYLDAAEKSGKFPLWMPYIFSGMPSYAALLTTGERMWDIMPLIVFGITKFFGTLFNSDVARMSVFYAIYAIGIYLLMRAKKHEQFTAFFSAFAAAFSTWVITWVMIGHDTKPVVFSMYPFVLLFVEKLREKFSFLWAALLVFAMHIMFEGGHLQLIFYFGCALAIYFIYELISRIVRKEQPLQIVKVGVVLVIAGALAFLMSADRYLSTLEYTKYSTRGSAPITKVKGQSQDASGGNDYDYATMWSYSPEEMFTLFDPSYFGFGIRDFEYQGQTMMLPSYWGQKESEDSPPYMGIGILMLAILGIIMFRKDVFVQFLIVLSLFGILLSFGKNLSVLYNLFYYYVPSFNKFRAPSMSLALMHFAAPILAGYGIAAIINWRKELTQKDKKLLIGFLIGSGVFLVIGFIFSGIFKSSYTDAVMNSQMGKSYGANFPSELMNFIWSNAMTDWYINGFFALAIAFAIYLFVNKKINKTILFVALAAILVIDLWRVDYRRMEISKEKAEVTTFANEEDVFNFIKQDKSLFRVADFASNPQNVPAYFLVENINGYHSAKLRIYQDLMDVANPDQYAGSTHQIFNPFLWNLLNVKYIITDRQLYQGIKPMYVSERQKILVYGNPGVLPRLFFVRSTQVAKHMDILLHLKNGDFIPEYLAYIESELPEKIQPPDSTVKAEVTNHENEYIRIEAEASGNNLLLISEMYYPSWHAYLDGKEIPIFKTDFALRSVIVPKGKHVIEMKFISKNFETGKTLSTISNVVCLLGLIGGIGFEWFRSRRRKKENQEIEENIKKD